jgi:hypothetical protein
MAHSTIVGGSSAKRLISCPGSRQLIDKVPPRPAGRYAEEGTMLHDVMHRVLSGEPFPEDLTEAQEDKIRFALASLEEIDPNKEMEFVTETRVHFGGFLAGVFGSCDLAGRIRNRAIMLDWKFGSGVQVEAEENEQGMFYTAAGMRTPELRWVFEGVTEIEVIIVQPPFIRRWVTTPGRIVAFERELVKAVELSFRTDAPIKSGAHCRFCAAKPICPALSGEVDRALATKVKALDAQQLADALVVADKLEGWIKDVRALAQDLLQKGAAVPGYKLVPKRATRQWADELKALEAFEGLVPAEELIEMRSPAQVEKVLKKHKVSMPPDLIVSVSSGNTLAPESDPRPAVITSSDDIRQALSKLR